MYANASLFNILSVLRQAWPDEPLGHAQPKRLRLAVFSLAGRFVRDRRHYMATT